MTITLTFPLPAKGLRPNDRPHRHVKGALIRQAREAGKRAMFEALKEVPPCVILGYNLKGYFKTKMHWDDDNLGASTKFVRDGIAEAAGQDDRTFKCLGTDTFTDKENPRLEVVITIEELI